jgi:regulatory factor X 4
MKNNHVCNLMTLLFFSVANVFSKSLRRKTSLTHLAQAARTVLHSSEPVTQMVNDWRSIDFNEIVKQTLWTFSSNPEADYEVIETCKYNNIVKS